MASLRPPVVGQSEAACVALSELRCGMFSFQEIDHLLSGHAEQILLHVIKSGQADAMVLW